MKKDKERGFLVGAEGGRGQMSRRETACLELPFRGIIGRGRKSEFWRFSFSLFKRLTKYMIWGVGPLNSFMREMITFTPGSEMFKGDLLGEKDVEEEIQREEEDEALDQGKEESETGMEIQVEALFDPDDDIED